MAEILPPGTLLHSEQYRIVKALGRGGFGITYQAFDSEFERYVAIKEFFPACARRNPTTGGVFFVTRTPVESDSIKIGKDSFLREGRNLAKVEHSSIPSVYDKFLENDTAYLVMAFIEGQSLIEKMPVIEKTPEGGVKRRRALPESESRLIIEDLVSALANAHRHGVYHLDIKPENVLIEKETGRAFLVDFGAARQKVTFDTSSEVALTPAYAPPELLLRQTCGPFTDIFELGMMLYQMLTGQLPPSAQARLIIPALNAWRPTELSEPWQSLLIEALQIDAMKRPGDIRVWWSKVTVLTAPSRHPEVVKTSATTVVREERHKKRRPPILWAYLVVGISGLTVAGIVLFTTSFRILAPRFAPTPTLEPTATATPDTPPKISLPARPIPDLASDDLPYINVKERTAGRNYRISFTGKTPTEAEIRRATLSMLKEEGRVTSGKPSLDSLEIFDTELVVRERTTGRTVTIPYTGTPPDDAAVRNIVYGALKATGWIKPGKQSFASLNIVGYPTRHPSDGKGKP